MPVRFTRNGGFQRMPSALPLSETSAKFFTTPRSSQICRSARKNSAGTSTSFSYVAVPEKYFTPESLWSGHEINLSTFTSAGAPQFGGKLKRQSPDNSTDAGT